jgi:hypothetical protein
MPSRAALITGCLTPTRARWPSSVAAPEVVADTIARALAAKRPQARYPVTPSAHLLINLRRVTPDRVWDLMMRAVYPTPRA